MRVFLADDHPLFRVGLRIALEREEGIELAGEASEGFSAAEKIQADPPDVALIDVDLPGLSGIRVIRMLRKILPNVKLLVLSTYDDQGYIKDAMASGADGYIIKCVEVPELVRIVRSIHNGLPVISPYLVNLTLESKPEESSDKDSEAIVLTQREKEVLKAIVDGRSNKEISDACYISIETVKSHIKSLYQKLQVSNRVEAAMIAVKRNLLS